MNIEDIDKYCDLFESQLRDHPDLDADQFVKEQKLSDDAALVRELKRVAREYRQQAQDSTSVATGPLQSGETVGNYKLLQKIGEGGMGSVYMAEQVHPVRRRVALKVVKSGMDSKEVIARFEAERQALAMMDHENIARIFDAGKTEQGSPYFVMELVRGCPITKYCDDHKLSISDRLSLFVHVCDAVQHAHQKGIIHRDIKPSNVIVANNDGKPIVKVIDFGVAKAMQQQLTDKTLFTEFGKVIGTIQYMSPEQAGLSHLDIDTRSDIYSLGVLLYELLTGTTPIEQNRIREAGFQGIMKVIREEEPPKPSTRISESADAASVVSVNRQATPQSLSSSVRGDLDLIVMMAIDKDRNRRYETANGFAMDLERYLKGQPVEAAPPSAAYRFKKFARRNKSALAFASSVVATLIVATVVSIWFAIRAARAEKKAVKESEVATAVAAFFEKDILAQSSPQYQPDREITLRTVLDRASEKIDNGRFEKQPHVEVSIRRTMGRSYVSLAIPDEAERHLKRARDLSVDLWGSKDPLTLNARNDLSAVYLLQSEYEKALELKKEVLADSLEVLGEVPDTALRMSNLANVNQILNELDSAEELLNRSIAIYDRFPEAPIKDKGKAIGNLAIVYAMKGQQLQQDEAMFKKAEAMFKKAEAMFKKLIATWEQEDAVAPETLKARYNLAYFYNSTGDFDQAEICFDELIPDMEPVLSLHPDYAQALFERSRNLFQIQEYDVQNYQKAKLALQEFITVCEKSEVLNESFYHFEGKNMLGHALAKLEESPEEVETLLVDGFEGMKKTVEAPHQRPRLPAAAQRIVDFYSARGDSAKEEMWKEKLSAFQSPGE